MNIEIITDVAGLEALRDEWVALERADPHASFYATHDWVRCWWAGHHDAPGVELHVVVVRQNRELVGIAPLAVHPLKRKGQRLRQLRVAGRGDELTFLVSPTANPRTVLKDVFKHLAGEPTWHEVDMTNIPAGSPLARHLLSSELHEHVRFHVESPYIDLEGRSRVSDLAVPDKLGNYRRRFLRDTGARFAVFEDDTDGIFARLAALHLLEKQHLIEAHGRDDRRSLFEDAHRYAHLEALYRTPGRCITFAYLDAAGELLAHRTCFRHGRRLLSWNSAYHPSVERYRVGKVIQYDIVDHVLTNDLADTFDLGAGRYPWKYEWTGEATVSYRVSYSTDLARPEPATPVSRPATTGGLAERPARPSTAPSSRLRRLARRLPLGIRRPLVTARRRLIGGAAPGATKPPAPGRDATSAETPPTPLSAAPPTGTAAAPDPAHQDEPTTSLGEPRPAVWYVPHPDDETIFMGGAIHHNRSAENLVVLLTRGGASNAINKVNAQLDTPIDREEFMAARLREFQAAVRHLGVGGDQVVVLDLPDGAIEESAVRHVVRDMEGRLPGASHRTMTPSDPHPDHAAAGRAVLNALRAHEIGDAVFLVPYPLVDAGSGVRLAHPDPGWVQAKRAALAEYQVWDPTAGRYAIGHHSVRKLLESRHDDPYERVDAEIAPG